MRIASTGTDNDKASDARANEGRRQRAKKLLAAVTTAALDHKPAHPVTPLILEQFTSVNITDATILTLPEKLAKFHKGFGGNSSEAAMKIQATLDIKSKSFRMIDLIDDATESDNGYVSRLVEQMGPNELYIFDLGYYGIEGFEAIAGKGAYFISKLKGGVTVCDSENTEVNLYTMLKSANSIDRTVIIKGSYGKTLQVRLVGVRLPAAVYSDRIRKARKTAESSGKTLSKEATERLKWILIVTNVERDLLSFDAICELYRMRWQIELVFKSWKSHFKLDEMNNVGKDYLDCLIIGKLITITALTALYSILCTQVFRVMTRRLSFLRFMKNMRQELSVISDYITRTKDLLCAAFDRVIRKSLIDIRHRKTTEQVISAFDLPLEVLIMLA